MIPITVTAEGKTTEEATQKGLQELGIEKEDAEIEIIEKGESGILWRAGKPARVKVSIRNALVLAKLLLQKILSILGIQAKVHIEQTEWEDVVMVEGENLGLLIGKRGTTLFQLQFLIQNVVRRHFTEIPPFSVDINRYMYRRKLKAVDMAKDAARKVRLTGREVALDGLNAYQRRLVHITLKSHPDVMTFSVGEGSGRRLIVKPKS